MSEARSVTNFIGNAVAAVVIAKHENSIDMKTFKEVVGV
jgi:Na+/H+-dicarboxylate symporter